jgi:hypothetical protein
MLHRRAEADFRLLLQPLFLRRCFFISVTVGEQQDLELTNHFYECAVATAESAISIKAALHWVLGASILSAAIFPDNRVHR